MTRPVTAPEPAAAPGGLAAVTGALLARARQDAESLLAEARSRAATVAAGARQRADEIVDQARSQGEADAAEALRGELSRNRREARARVLQAECAAYDELRRRATAQVTDLLERRDADVRALLVREAAERLGPGAELRDDGGPVAVLGRRRLSIEPAQLVEQALEQLGPELSGLWSP